MTIAMFICGSLLKNRRLIAAADRHRRHQRRIEADAQPSRDGCEAVFSDLNSKQRKGRRSPPVSSRTSFFEYRLRHGVLLQQWQTCSVGSASL